MDETNVQIVLRWKEENEQIVALVQAQLAAMKTQQDATNTSLLGMAQSAWAAAGGWGQIAIAVGAAAIVFAPIAALILSAAVALVSFTVAAAGTLALMAGLAAGFAAIGAAIVGLGIMGMGGLGSNASLATATANLAAAQDAVNNLGGGAGGGAVLTARKRALEDAQKALADFDAQNAKSGLGGAAAFAAAEAARQALKDFDALHTGAASPAAQKARDAAQAALDDFDALHAAGTLSLAQQQQREDLQLRLTQAQDAYNQSGVLTIAQEQQREDLVKRLAAAQQALDASGTSGLTLAQQQQREDMVLRLKRAEEDLNTAQSGGGAGGASRQAALERLAKAQEAFNAALLASQQPIAVFQRGLDAMLTTWEALSVPVATAVIQWAQGALPAVTNLGVALISWFGDRVPPVLAGIGQVIKDLSPPFTAFFTFLGGVADHVGPQMSAVAEMLVQFGLGAVQGLIANLVRLSDWFQKELPALGPIVQSIFDWMGRVIQELGKNWAALTDWVIANWPATVADAKKQLELLGGAFKDLADPKGQMHNTMQGFIDTGTALKSISDNIAPLLSDLGKLNKALQPIADVLNAIADAFNRNGLWLHNIIDNPKSIAQQAQDLLGLSHAMDSVNAAGGGGVAGHTGTGRTGTQPGPQVADLSTTNSHLARIAATLDNIASPTPSGAMYATQKIGG